MFGSFPMKRSTGTSRSRALRARVVLGILAASTLIGSSARADDNIGIVLSSSPSGAPTRSIRMTIPAEESGGSIPIFIRQTTDKTLYGVRLSATPLVDETGVASITPAFDPERHTLPFGGALRRSEVIVARLGTLGTFTSTLYATLANRTQTLGTLTVVHTLRRDELRIAAIPPATADQSLPGSATSVTLLVSIRNTGDRAASFSAPTIASLTADGKSAARAGMPSLRVSGGSGGTGGGEGYTLGPGEATTLRVVIGGVKRTGRYAGSLRIAADGHVPVEQSFAFRVKDGPVLPVILIALGVVISYGIRRRYSSGRIGRAGQRRLADRLLSDVRLARAGVRDVEVREALAAETLERRLVDIADRLEHARASKSADALGEIDHKIDLFLSMVQARAHIRAVSPKSLQAEFEPLLDEVAGFLAEETSRAGLEARFASLSRMLGEIPAAVETTVRERFRADVDRLMAGMDARSSVVEALPIRVIDRVSKAKQLAGEGRFAEARTEMGAAQLAFARLLAEDLTARMPEADVGPPGFVAGWPRFRASVGEALRAVRRERRGEQAAAAYRRVWQDYVAELASRLKTAAARDRRQAAGKRKAQLALVVEACDHAVAKAGELDPEAVEAYRFAVQGYLSPPGSKRSSARVRAALEEATLPPPMTVVAAALADVEPGSRPAPDGKQSVAVLTRQIRKRHVGLALLAAVAAIPTGLVVLWSPNETWGTLADGAAAFGWGFGLQAVCAALDARRLGWVTAKDARSAMQREAPAALAGARGIRAEREPAR